MIKECIEFIHKRTILYNHLVKASIFAGLRKNETCLNTDVSYSTCVSKVSVGGCTVSSMACAILCFIYCVSKWQMHIMFVQLRDV